MRPKRNFSFGLLKYSDPSYYIEHEKIDVLYTCPTLKEVIDSNEIKLFNLPKLQIEVENISSILSYRMMNLKALIDGNPLQIENKSLDNASKSSQYLQFFALPNSESKSIESELNLEQINEELIMKIDQDIPIAHLTSQNLPEAKTASCKINGKRKIIEDIPAKKLKRQKSLHVNNKDIKPNYEIPNKFWELMEPYCSEINEEHIRTLENYIQNYETDEKYYELPVIKIVNDRLSENQSINGTDKNHLNGFMENKSSIDLSNLLKKIDSEIRKPLSQTKTLKGFPRSLVDLMSQETDDLISTHKLKVKNLKNGISSDASCISTTLAKQLKVSNSFKIEKYIKKTVDELGMCNVNLPFVPKLLPQFNLCKVSDEQGIAKSNDSDTIDAIILNGNDHVELHLPNSTRSSDLVSENEDKALLGLRRRQAELKLVSESNLGMLKRLMGIAKRDMKRQEIERRLAVVDADVIDSYNVIESYRPTRRPPLKKDRDSAYKALRERQKVLKELDAFDSEFF